MRLLSVVISASIHSEKHDLRSVLLHLCISAYGWRRHIPQLGEIEGSARSEGFEQGDEFDLAVGAGFGEDGLELAT